MKRVIAQFRFEGVHRWEECDLPQVKYLQELHRHIFHVRVEVEVRKNNRQIEFIDLKHLLQDMMYGEFDRYPDGDDSSDVLHLGFHSCEDIAEMIFIEFKADLVEVLEDGENGAVITR